MAPTILVVGSTGNTGQSALLAIHSETAKELSKIPHVEVAEKDWTDTDIQWLKDNEIVRIFLASFNTMSAFALEANFLNNARLAGVKYIVRISTTPMNVSATTEVYYGRTHWAIENLLSQPEFKSLQWTSLQPQVFTNSYFTTCVSWLQNCKKTGKQEPLGLMADESTPNAVLDPSDVGELGAHLLAQDDPSKHSGARYVINGPENITGKQMVEILEQHIGEKVQKVTYNDMSFIDGLRQSGDMNEQAVRSIALAPVPTWEGRGSVEAMPTSEEVLELAPPRRGASRMLREMLNEV